MDAKKYLQTKKIPVLIGYLVKSAFRVEVFGLLRKINYFIFPFLKLL